MIELFKKQNELKHASLARRQFVLEAEEHARFNFVTSFVDYFIIISTVTKQKKYIYLKPVKNDNYGLFHVKLCYLMEGSF